MNKKTYWTGLNADEKRALADRCETSVPYLHQIFHGHRTPGRALAKKIEHHSSQSVTAYELVFGDAA